jgi:1-pyrroline-5-carboxylate dehydrogenase
VVLLSSKDKKCSTASRAYVPQKYVASCKTGSITDVKSKMGSPEDFSNFVTAVIHEGSFDSFIRSS